MGRIPEETIETLRDRVDIVDLVGRHVSLRQSGRSFKGLCPFHDEKTPSFHVTPERGIFHCFGCGVGGDAFQFLMRHENLSFPEAVRSLARECGIEIPESEGGESGLGETLRDLNERAQALYRRALSRSEGAAARTYLAGRGLDDEAAERFGIGFAPDAWDTLTRALGKAKIPAEQGEKAGLLAARQSGGHYDLLRNRITFPIHDVRGRTIGFGGRALSADQEPKYLNTPETPVFRKREVLYGFPEALAAIRKSGRAVISEGYFDRIALAQDGVPEAVATCGTALSAEHAKGLRRRTAEVVLLFDGDAAGLRAMERALEILLPEGLRVRAGSMPSGSDPADVLQTDGPGALRRIVDEAPPALSQLIRRASENAQASPWEKADAVGAVVRVLALVQDAVERGEFSRQLALAVDARVEDIDAALRAERAGRRGRDEAPVEVRRRLPAEEARQARRLAQILLERPELCEEIVPDAERAQRLARFFPEPPWPELFTALASAPREGDLYHALAATLGEDAQELLRSLVAVGGAYDDSEAARRVANDTLLWAGERERKRLRRQTTKQLREDPGSDPAEFLAEKQRQLEERRAAQGFPPKASAPSEQSVDPV